MQKVDEYIHHAKQVRAEANGGVPAKIGSALLRIADEWELLARERLELLQLKIQNGRLGLD
jgi:hypothetical protein